MYLIAISWKWCCYVLFKQNSKQKPSMKFVVLINVKMPTIVGILTFISMINTTYEGLKAQKVWFFCIFVFNEQFKFHAHLSWAWKNNHGALALDDEWHNVCNLKILNFDLTKCIL